MNFSPRCSPVAGAAWRTARLSGVAITENVIDEHPVLRGVPKATLDGLRELFQLCNQARYAPVRGTSELNSVAAQFEKEVKAWLTSSRVEGKLMKIAGFFAFCYKILIRLAALRRKPFRGGCRGGFFGGEPALCRGKFPDAAATYEKILQTGGQSPALLFNYANAEFKAGSLGKAIAAYRRAELLAPRDSEIRANLAFVRNQVQGATIRESRWQNWLGQLTLNEWTLLAAGAFWLTFLLLAVKQIRPALAPKLRSATRIFVADGFFRRGFGVAGGKSFFWGNRRGGCRRGDRAQRAV
jgi:hypothetical protein